MSEELTGLLGRVRAATGPDREIDAAFHALTHSVPFRFVGQLVEMEFHHADEQTKRWHKSHDTRDNTRAVIRYVPYTSSLDAIVALIERKHQVMSLTMTIDPSGCGAKLTVWPQGLSGGIETRFDSVSHSVELACCAVFLSSLSAQEDKL